MRIVATHAALTDACRVQELADDVRRLHRADGAHVAGDSAVVVACEVAKRRDAGGGD